MVMAILEPICAGIMVSLINNYIQNNLGYMWESCACEEPIVSDDITEEGQMKDEEEEEEEHEAVSSQNTTISDAVHVQCHHFDTYRLKHKPLNARNSNKKNII